MSNRFDSIYLSLSLHPSFRRAAIPHAFVFPFIRPECCVFVVCLACLCRNSLEITHWQFFAHIRWSDRHVWSWRLWTTRQSNRWTARNHRRHFLSFSFDTSILDWPCSLHLGPLSSDDEEDDDKEGWALNDGRTVRNSSSLGKTTNRSWKKFELMVLVMLISQVGRPSVRSIWSLLHALFFNMVEQFDKVFTVRFLMLSVLLSNNLLLWSIASTNLVSLCSSPSFFASIIELLFSFI